MKVVNIETSEVHKVFAYLLSQSGAELVWSKTWPGTHTIGIDCYPVEDSDVKKVKKMSSITIAIEVGKYLNVPPEVMSLKTNKREIVIARQISHYFSKKLTEESLVTIGLNIGGKNHATVLSSINQVKNLIETDRRFAEMIKEINKILENVNKNLYQSTV